MRRFVVLLTLASAGCSNAPLAGTLDLIRPSRPERLGLDAGQPIPGEMPAPETNGRLLFPATPTAPAATPQKPGSEIASPPIRPGNSLPLPPPEPPPSTPQRPPLPPNT